MRLTKEQMVKDIFFLATQGKRSTSNYVDGMWLIETIAKNNYAWAIKDWWNQVEENPTLVGAVFYKMTKQTHSNTQGVRGDRIVETDTSRRVWKVYDIF